VSTSFASPRHKSFALKDGSSDDANGGSSGRNAQANWRGKPPRNDTRAHHSTPRLAIVQAVLTATGLIDLRISGCHEAVFQTTYSERRRFTRGAQDAEDVSDLRRGRADGRL
jgi:hypothetical protein